MTDSSQGFCSLDKLLFTSRAKPTAHEPNCSYTLKEPELLHMSQTTEAFDLAKLLQTFDFDYHSYSKLLYVDHSNLVLVIPTCTIGVNSFVSLKLFWAWGTNNIANMNLGGQMITMFSIMNHLMPRTD